MLGFSLFLLMLSLSLTTLWSFSPAAASRAVGPRLTSRSAPSRCRSLVGGRQGYHASSATLQATEEEVDPGAVEGTDKRIVKYPHPSLRAENGLCTDEEITDGTIAKLAKEMFLIMYAANGVGLAAPQVGVNKRLMVYNPSGDKKKWMEETVWVNPVIVGSAEGEAVEEEGCLSFPGMQGRVNRPKWIKIEGKNLKGKTFKKKFTGFESRVFQHEYDHLDGVVYIDRLIDEEERELVQERLNELVAEFGDGGVL